jgi:sterol desaturase/sphingolipid hydroxylase (fatty acid hydroxylase superfamily)
MAKKKSLSRRPLAEQSLPSEVGTNRIVSLAQGIVASSTFDWIITGVILLQALAIALEATPAVVQSVVGMRTYSSREHLDWFKTW